MKIAYFSPLSPVRSGISDYSEELLPELARKVERIDLFVDGYVPANPRIRDGFCWHEAAEFPRLGGASAYDAVIYQQGNNPHHEYIYRQALGEPGLLVLHDHVLHHLVTEMTLARGEPETYLEELLANHGPLGREMGLARLGGAFSDLQNFLYPCSWRLARASRGVLVHSRYLARLLRSALPEVPVARVPMGVRLPEDAASPELRRQAREALGLPQEGFLVGSFGFVTPMKRLDLALAAFARLRWESGRPALLLVVGEVSPACRLEALAGELGLTESVRLAGFVDRRLFQRYLQAVDLALNLRYPTAGETSASLLRVMGSGVPVVVPRYRQYCEFPEETCLHLAPGADEEERLAAILLRLSGDEDLRARLGRRARAHVAGEQTVEAAVEGYLAFLRRLAARRTALARQPTLAAAPAAPRAARGWHPGARRAPAGAGPFLGDGYRRNSRVPGRLAVRLRVLDRLPALAAGEEGAVRLQLTNCGDTVWLARPAVWGGYVVVAARFHSRQGLPPEGEQPWQRLPEDVPPGHSVELICRMRAPERPGSYALRFDLLDVGLGWFAAGEDPDSLPGFDLQVV